ncbi:MAG: hypothetical protein LBC71_07035 [Oscillospiraceae bacterium]|nr:hypothetical protein [Oscillospiraceae bacterium]
MVNRELVEIIEKFAGSGWDLIDAVSNKWLADNSSEEIKDELLVAVEQADKDCGSCGCDYDVLYKRALELLRVA